MDKMRNKHKYSLFFILGVLIGAMIGAIVINILVSYRIDSYIKEIKSLRKVIEEKDTRLEKLQQNINNKKIIVNDIQVEIKYEDDKTEDDIVKITLEKHIKNKFKCMLGKEVKNVDGEMLVEVIDKRIMKIDGKEYQIKVKRIMISQVIKFWIEIKVIKE
ncbi:hypothetical protein RBU49_09540 [Clostridium sp. MB40-C1]|uniref:hypothetical protein n=1 Tax=Clostridium sp. MB40-C1 TaxID=3070996 RepID=UPI0027E12204|nr:hypothetical protein [Clostridium sp. MB40-C1]WMJ79134.1 hypothetical protein RBU49_09540 [Clostridium sp. MB40-C1]